MRIRSIIFCVALLTTVGYNDANAQGFLGKLKNLGKQIENKVESQVKKKIPKGKVSAPSSKKIAIWKNVSMPWWEPKTTETQKT